MSQYIINRLICKNYIQENVRESYQYGMLVLVMNLIPILIILGISIIVNKLIFGFLFLISFVPIRVNIGGYHCKKTQNCIISFVLIYISILYLSYSMFYNLIKILGVICIISIFFLTPITYDVIDNIDKNKKKKKKRLYKYMIIIILFICLFSNKYNIIAMYMACILNVLLYFIGKLDLKRRGVV